MPIRQPSRLGEASTRIVHSPKAMRHVRLLLTGYLVTGFVVSTYLLATMRSARPTEPRWDKWIVAVPEIWILAVAFWPLYLTVRIMKVYRRASPQPASTPEPREGGP